VALASLDEKLGAVLISLGHYGEALTALDRAAETYRAATEVEGLRRTLARIAEVYTDTARSAQGLARLLPLLEVVEAEQATPGLAALYVGLADLYAYEHRQAAALVRPFGRAATMLNKKRGWPNGRSIWRGPWTISGSSPRPWRSAATP
jgi:hypothetical protein